MSSLKEEWSRLYGTLTEEDIKGIGEALSGFFSLLKMWNDKEVIDNDTSNGGNVPSNGA